MGAPNVLPLALLLTAPAFAHPFGGAMPGHDISLSVDASGVTLEYRAALPTHDVLSELEEAGVETQEAADAFTQAKLAELAAGLSGRVDADPLRWEHLDPERETGRGDQRLVRFEQRLALRRDRAPGVLLLSNGNAPDQLSYFRWQVEVAPELEVTECSLVDLEEGVVTETRHGQWRMDEAQRELVLRLRPRRLGWVGALLGEGDGAPRPVHEAMAMGPLVALRAGVLSRELALGVMLGLAGAGALRAGRWRHRVDALAVITLGLAVLHAPPLAGALAGLYLAGALLTRGHGQGPLGALLASAVAGLMAWCWLS